MTEERRRKELLRRSAVLALVMAALAGGLWAFYARQSLVIGFRPAFVTRTLLPVAYAKPDPLPAQVRTASAVPVLVYHGIVPVGESCNVTPETFQDHMETLHAAGYEALTLEQFARFIEAGEPIPERSVLITFDDGRTDSFAGADSVLERFGYRATMFTVLGAARSGKPFYLTAEEIRMLARTGRWDIGSHTTASHDFARVDPMGREGRTLASRLWDADRERLESDTEYAARVRADLAEAKAGLTALAGRPVTAFAYPFGDYGDTSEDPVIRNELPRIASSLYALTFRQASETLDETYDYPFDRGTVLRRIYISSDTTAEQLLARLERGKPKPLPFRDPSSFRSGGWALVDGDLRADGSGRDLVSAEGRAEAFLDGSRAWTDYAVDASFALPATETVSLVVRRAGPQDYVAVTISRTYTSVEQVLGGKRLVLAQRDLTLGTDGGPRRVRLSVEGRKLGLEIDGRGVMSTAALDGRLLRGGVGFRADPATGPAGLRLDTLQVVPLGTRAAADRVASKGGW